MPVILLGIPFAFFLCICAVCYTDGKKFCGNITLLVCISIILWLGFSLIQPKKINRSFETKVSLVDGASVIAYKDYYDEFKIVNLNDNLKKNVPLDSKVKVTIYDKCYVGLLYDGPMIPDEYEVLTPED